MISLQERLLSEPKRFNKVLVNFSLYIENIVMKWRGKKIANVDSFFDFIDKSDPYLKFLKIRGDNTYI